MDMEAQDPACQAPGCQQGGDASCCKKKHRALKTLVVTIAIVEIVLAIFYLYHFGAKLARENARAEGSLIIPQIPNSPYSPAVFKQGLEIEGFSESGLTLTNRGAFAGIIGLEVFRFIFGILLIVGAVLDNFIICAVWIKLTVLRIVIEFLFEAESQDFKVLYFHVTILYIFFGLAVFCFAVSAKKMSGKEWLSSFGKKEGTTQPTPSDAQPPSQPSAKPSMSAPVAKPSMSQPA